ncbi:hypothetical protein [Planotetraspora kaengkrachanensis]|uniref:DUF4118 domain-containing protein n=1 Tax=Planotetraspora kaengkrachanensis TaxID=575193 RepID=A0A8J3Q152_9ACTN|nr:hypothetical protein [Planotetraspora kaengkrachanensis]GIG85009.1 hypothetical protein Pka01_81360 [Planotetraspora kaengkrachanensis]
MRIVGPAGLRHTELLVAAGFAVVVGGCLLATAIFPPGQTTGRIAVLAGVLAVFAARAADPVAALATAVMGWLVATGFLVNQEGELRLAGWPDLWRLAVLVAAVVAGTLWGRIRIARRAAAVRVIAIAPEGSLLPAAATILDATPSDEGFSPAVSRSRVAARVRRPV